MLVLAGQGLFAYRRAMQALEPIGASRDTAAVRFAELMQRNNGGLANKLAAPHRGVCGPVKPKLVAKVLKDLLAAKAEKGRSHLYLTDLRVRLTRFAEAMARPLSEVTAADIEGFLRSLELSARSQNHFRAAIGTLFRFGQTRGHVPQEHPCVSNVEKVSHTAPEIQVFTPDEMEKLLGKAKPKLVPALALGAL
jgi:hypothetical protein